MSVLTGFDYTPRTRLVYGCGGVDRIGELAAGLRAGRVLVVTDPGIVSAGHVDRVVDSLKRSTLEPVVFDGVIENPTTREVDACVEAAKSERIDTIIGLGGGSSMDTAKGCNFLLTNGGRMQDYWGLGKARKPMLPLIAVPTTAGTGSECQSFALIADEETHQKMACGDPKAAAHIALLDPELTLTQPFEVTAHTGVDALSHALETAVTQKRTPLSQVFSREAFRLVQNHLPLVLEDPENLEARAATLLGAAYAGTAIENSMLGAAHAAANPLTAHYAIVHGEAVGVMLPTIVRFNGQDPETAAIYSELARYAGLSGPDDPTHKAVDTLAERLNFILHKAGMAQTLSALEIPQEDFNLLAEEASKQWTGTFNPRKVNEEDFRRIYQAAHADSKILQTG